MIDYGYCQSEACWGDAYMDGPSLRKTMQGIKDIGGSRVRMGVQVGTWADLDRAVSTAVEFGLKPLLCILGNPGLVPYSTNNVVAYGDLCKQIALRYGPSGVGALKNTVSEYEIFNEMNSAFNPPSNSSGAAYVPFLKAAYTAIKSVHSSSTVISGGTVPTTMIWFGWATDPLEWYTAVYAAGGKDYMDAVGFHLYADVETPSPAMRQWKYMTDIRDLMVAQGDGAKKVWVTEVGASFPGPGITSAVMARDWLKLMVDGILSYPWCGPLHIYGYRSTSKDTNDAGGGNYGIVTNDFLPKSPIYQYAQTIVGTPADVDDIVPPTPPTSFSVVTTGPQTASATWNPAMDDVGVSVYRIYNAENDTAIGQTTQVGLTSHQLSNLTPGTPYVAYVTAFDAAGNESDPSDTFPFTTDAPTGSQAFFQYDFTGTGSTVPPVFVQLGLGFTVSGGVALPNPPTVDGVHVTVMPYTTDQRSPDHSSQIGVAAGSNNPYLAALSLVQMNADGTQFVGSLIAGGGVSDACKIFTYFDGVLTVRDARNQPPLLPDEYLITTADSRVYTATRVRADGTRTDVFSWADLAGVYPGSANLRTGGGWLHTRVGGINYPPPGITGLFKASDLAPVNPSGGSADQLWHLAIAKPSRLGLVLATDLWQVAL